IVIPIPKRKGSIMIPPEIVNDILCRLPSKSVGRFRSVSKEWLSLLTEPAFLKTHQITGLKRNHLVFSKNRGRSWYSHPLNHHESVLTPTNLLIESDHRLEFNGSCNGLVLISHKFHFDALVVFNPTTGESVQLPQSDYFDVEPWRISHGIGYDSVTDDYKVITLTTFKDEENNFTNFAFLYSLRDNTWKCLGDFPYFVDSRHGVYLDGFLNWIFGKGIVTFNLAEERFSLIPVVPDVLVSHDGDDFHITGYSATKITVLGGKLAIYWHSNVMLMNEYGIKESWIMLRLDRFDDIPMIGYTMIFYDNHEIRVSDMNRGMMLIYDFEKRTFSQNMYVWDMYTFKLEDTYTESLVSPKINAYN
uniref:F-box/kelch-repeat protein At3g06240-like n=1 Tax=Erigeron canadensis TaxID=72917 RepID=UPI001CB94836